MCELTLFPLRGIYKSAFNDKRILQLFRENIKLILTNLQKLPNRIDSTLQRSKLLRILYKVLSFFEIQLKISQYSWHVDESSYHLQIIFRKKLAFVFDMLRNYVANNKALRTLGKK